MKNLLAAIILLFVLLTSSQAGMEILHFDASKPNADGTYNAVDKEGRRVILDMQKGTATTVPTNTTININPWLFGGGLLILVLFTLQSFRHTKALRKHHGAE